MSDIYSNFEQHVMTVGVAESSFPTVAKYGAVRQPQAIFVQTPTTNTAEIVLGQTGIAADYSTGGFLLPVGADAILPFNRDEQLVAISSAADQKLFVTYLSGK